MNLRCELYGKSIERKILFRDEGQWDDKRFCFRKQSIGTSIRFMKTLFWAFSSENARL